MQRSNLLDMQRRLHVATGRNSVACSANTFAVVRIDDTIADETNGIVYAINGTDAVVCSARLGSLPRKYWSLKRDDSARSVS